MSRGVALFNRRGRWEGGTVGSVVGCGVVCSTVGCSVGAAVGLAVGSGVGATVARVGAALGAGVGGTSTSGMMPCHSRLETDRCWSRSGRCRANEKEAGEVEAERMFCFHRRYLLCMGGDGRLYMKPFVGLNIPF